MEEKTALQKWIGFFGTIFYVLFLLLSIGLLAVSLSMKKDEDGAANFFGRQMRIVLSDSMEKCNATDVSGYKIQDIPVKTLIIIQTVPKDAEAAEEWYGNLKKGDVLTFRYAYAKQETITHRLTEEPIPTEGGYILHLSGDNKTANSNTLTQTIDTSQTNSPNYVVGKVTSTSYAAGVVLVALKAPVGMVCILILPSFVLLLVGVCRLCLEASKQRQRALEELTDAQGAEIARLQRKLKTLQRQSYPTKTRRRPTDRKRK